MMKITDIETYILKYPYKTFIADGLGTCGGRGSFLLVVKTDEGIDGIGEAASFGGSMAAMREIVNDQMKPLLIGEDPLQIEKLWQKMFWNNWANGRHGLVMGVLSGIDIALWDILGKKAGLPLATVFGAYTDRVQGYASAGFYAKDKSLEDLQRECEAYLEQGYTAFKMKVGRTYQNRRTPLQFMINGDYLYDQEEDRKRVETVRKTIGKEAILMLDMNCTWSVADVLASEQFFEENNIYMIEEPARSDDIEGYSKIANSLKSVRVAGCESAQGIEQYQNYLRAGALDVVQADIAWCGGFSEARRIASLALAYNKLFTPHTFFSAVLTAANIHFSAAQVNVPFIEAEQNENPFRTELLRDPLQVDDHMNYLVPQGPGLGIELNWDTVSKYAV